MFPSLQMHGRRQRPILGTGTNVAPEPHTRDAGRNRAFQTERPQSNSPPVDEDFSNEVTLVKSSASQRITPKTHDSQRRWRTGVGLGRTWFIRCSDFHRETASPPPHARGSTVGTPNTTPMTRRPARELRSHRGGLSKGGRECCHLARWYVALLTVVRPQCVRPIRKRSEVALIRCLELGGSVLLYHALIVRLSQTSPKEPSARRGWWTTGRHVASATKPPWRRRLAETQNRRPAFRTGLHDGRQGRLLTTHAG